MTNAFAAESYPRTLQFEKPHIQEARFERAIETGNFVVASVISKELVNHRRRQQGTPLNRTRAELQNLALPLYEHVHNARLGRRDTPEITEELSGIYQQSGEYLSALTEERRSIRLGRSGIYLQYLHEINGGISEMVAFSLFAKARQEQRSPWVVLPTSRSQDKGTVNSKGVHRGVDFIAHHDDDPRTTANIQIKTTSHNRPNYSRQIAVIGIDDLTGEYSAAKFTLPNAILDDTQGNANDEQKKLIDAATNILLQKTKDGSVTVNS